MKRGTILNYCKGALVLDKIVENEKSYFERV